MSNYSMTTNLSRAKGVVAWPVIIGVLVLVSIGIAIGKVLPSTTPETEATIPSPTANLNIEASESADNKITPVLGKISGYLIYPSDHIPPNMGVCAELVSDTNIKTCVKQTKDNKYKNGVGFEMNLPPDKYYVYSFLGDQQAYYSEFVTCGLKANCPSHAKIIVTVESNKSQDNILPHDWYNTESTPTSSVSIVKPSDSPTVTAIPSLIKMNPNLLKKLPTATPSVMKVIDPTIKIKL